MRKFFNGDGDNGEFDFDGEAEDESGRNVEISIDTDVLGAMELDLAEVSLNHQLLDRAIKVAKQNVFWWFKSPAKKMKCIEKIYRRLDRLVMINEQE